MNYGNVNGVDDRGEFQVEMDPKNIGFPTYWHARGYGLFSANPLGQEVFSNGKEKLNFTLEPKQSVTFRYRLLIFSGPTTPDQIEAQYQRFVNDRSLP